MPFSNLGLDAALVRGVRELGFERPTPVQERVIPAALEGRDLSACATTGSGKTAAFVLPILQRLEGKPRGTTRALVLTPTRELALQIEQHLQALAAHTRLSSASVVGGMNWKPQEQALRKGADVVIATPGRLLDHFRFPYARLSGLEILVLDEADRMLDMGFLPDIRRILKHVPAQRQTLLFSATMPKPILALAQEMLKSPATIRFERDSAPAVGITQTAYPVPPNLKSALLAELVKRGQIRSVIVFTRTKHRADRVADYLQRRGVAAGLIHGDRSQSQRTQAIQDFKAGRFPVLVATDIAARGLHVEALSHVVNYDLPSSVDDYVHRVGRTGRLEATGDAFLFVAPEEEGKLREIERALGRKLPRLTLPGFDYAKTVTLAPLAAHHAAGFRMRRGGGRSPQAGTRRLAS